MTALEWPVAALIITVMLAGVYLAALFAAAALMVAWHRLRRRPDPVERLLVDFNLELEAERPPVDMGYMTGGTDPRFDPAGAPHPAFRKTRETT